MTDAQKGTIAHLATAALLSFAANVDPKMLGTDAVIKRINSYVTQGADVTAKNDDGETPAHIFARRDSFSALQALLAASGNLDVLCAADNENMAPLMRLAENNNSDINQYLQFDAFRAELTRCNNKGQTIAYLFAEWGNEDMVSYLLELCPEVKMQGIMHAVQNSTKMTPHEKADARETFRYAGF